MARSFKILILEKNDNNQEIISNTLQSLNIDPIISFCSNKSEFIAALKNSPDFIFASAAKARYRAKNALAYINSKNLLIPLVVLSDEKNNSSALELIKEGAQDYLEWEHLERLPLIIRNLIEIRDTQSKLSRLEIQEQEKKDNLSGLLSFATDFNFVVNLDSDEGVQIEWINQSMGSLMDYSVEEINEIGYLEIIHPDDQPQVIKNFELILAGHPIKGETRIIDKSGNIKYFHYSVYPQLDPDTQTIKNLYGAANDITHYKKSEVLYTELFNNISIGLYRTTPDGKLIDVNQACVDLFQYPNREELLNQSAAQLYATPDLRDKWIKAMDDDGVARNFIAKVKRYDGSLLWTKENSRVVKDQKGEILYFEGSIQDIHSEQKAEESLNESEIKYRTLFQESGEAVFLSNLEGNLIEINSAFAELFGFSEEELITMSTLDVFEDPDSARRATKMIADNGPGKFRIEEKMRCKDGSTFEAMITFTVGEKKEDGQQFLHGIVRNITDLKQGEKELEAVVSVYNALRSSNRVSELQPIILEHIINSGDLDAAALEMIDPNTGTSKILSANGLWGNWVIKSSSPSEEISEKILRDGASIVLNENDIGEMDQHVLNGINHIACIPLIASDNPIGVLWSGKISPIPDETLRLITVICNIAAVTMNRVNLFEEKERSLREGQAVSDISKSLNETLDLPKIFQLIVDSTEEVIPKVDRAVIHLFDPEKKLLHSVAMKNNFPTGRKIEFPKISVTPDGNFNFDDLSKKDIEAASMRSGQGIAGMVIEGGSTINVFDIKFDDRFVYKPGTSDIRSMVVTPIIHHDKRIGTISILSKSPNAFTRGDERLLEQLSIQATTALLNAQRYEAEQASRELAEAKAEISSLLSQSLELNIVLDRILEQTTNIVACRGSNIMLIENNNLSVHRMRGYENKYKMAGAWLKNDLVLSLENIKYMIEEKEPFIINDVHEFGSWEHEGAPDWVKSSAGIPLVVAEEVFGFLMMDSDITDYFTEDMIEKVKSFADDAAIAVNNARLYKMERDQRHLAQAQAEISAVLNQTLEVDVVLDRILEETQKIVAFSSANIMLIQEGKTKIVGRIGYPNSNGHSDKELLFDHEETFTLSEMMRTKKPMIINDTAKHPKWRQDRGLPWVKSYMGIPLSTDEEVIGFLNLDSREKDFFSEEMATRLLSFANDVAMAVNNANLYNQLESALAQEQATRGKLIRADKLAGMGRMVASVAHELNNPLQTIKNCLFLIEQSTKSPENLELLEMSMSEIERLSDIVDRLREVYRPREFQATDDLSILSLLFAVEKLADTHLKRNQTDWQFSPSSEDYIVQGIQDQLIQVLLNLSLNAMEAMQPEGGLLETGLILDQDTNQIGVTFKDTGPGIPEDEIAFIFDPFYTTKETGMGLGLSICYDIAQNHNGSITVENDPNQGVIFTLWLPVIAVKEIEPAFGD